MSVGGANRVTHPDVCRRPWARLTHAENLRKMEHTLSWESFSEMGRIPFSLVMSLEFRAISSLLVVVIQINPLHPWQIVAMSGVQSWGAGKTPTCCGCNLCQAKCSGELCHTCVPQLQGCTSCGAVALFQLLGVGVQIAWLRACWGLILRGRSLGKSIPGVVPTFFLLQYCEGK